MKQLAGIQADVRMMTDMADQLQVMAESWKSYIMYMPRKENIFGADWTCKITKVIYLQVTYVVKNKQVLTHCGLVTLCGYIDCNFGLGNGAITWSNVVIINKVPWCSSEDVIMKRS